MNFIEDKILEKGNLDKLTLRFPPEPNGILHLGHAKSICLNFGLADKYNGKCNLRFDDTNPLSEEKAFVDAIIEDVKWLGFKPSNIVHASDYFEFIYNCAITLIKKGLAYVDDSTSEEIASLKGTPISAGTNSPYRNRTVDENLELFNRMKSGDGSSILRAKIDMASPNMILRDPVIYRIINKTHHHTGDTWKVYPMYDFAHPLSDYVEGVTESLCTLEFEVHRPLYNWVLENCDLTGTLPEETEFARLNLDYTVMSKRKLKRLVEEGFVAGWDDPRMPTISGLRRRGFTPESIRDFCDRISVTKNESVVSYLLLEECLRNDLNKSANRIMGVMDPLKLVIDNWDKLTEIVFIENNPEDPTAGLRMVPFDGTLWIEKEDFSLSPDKKYNRLKIGGEVRLKGAYIVKANSVVKDADGKITEIHCTYDPLTKSGMEVTRKIKGTIHWVSCNYGVSAEVREYDKLFTKSDPDIDDDFTNNININSLVINSYAIFEPSIKDCKIGAPVQMMRKGYYVLDKDSNIDKMVFNKTVSLRESYKPNPS